MAESKASERRRAVQDFKRAAILEAAREVFAGEGVDGATVRAIAAQAGYSPGALYAYFPSKEDIQAELVANAFAELAGVLRGAGSGGLVALARAYVDFFAERPDLFRLLMALRQSAGDGLGTATARQLNGRVIGALRHFAAAFEAQGAGPDETNRRTLALHGQLNGLLQLAVSGRLDALGFRLDELVATALEALDRSA